ncbi:recombinase family protein [Shimia sp. R9_2]|uniref:recombinase family protein n=1 Tax=Shimia sp. R9_2 TaxID=2821112 RepID=UPI001ADAC5C0|nr:recombinase family protein [Shimia sp. R9_2]MBO9398781.1 recombinase family protein [Shimia sp. R9_2]
MKIGYARTSTFEQSAGLEAQIRDLENAGCERIFTEQVSSVDLRRRERLDEALSFVRQGDTLVVTKLDRLARSMSHLVEIRQQLDSKQVSLSILDLNLDTSTATGKLMINLLGSVAEFERSIMLERQREGIAKAKAAGKYKGRKPTARAKADEIRALKAQGVSPTEIARRLEIGRASVYRILNDTTGRNQ